MKFLVTIVPMIFLFVACKEESPVVTGDLQLISISVGTEKLSFTDSNLDLPFDQAVVIRFSQAIDITSVSGNIFLYDNNQDTLEVNISFLDSDKTISVNPGENLNQNDSYSIVLGPNLKGKNGESFPGITLFFTTGSLPLNVVSIFIDGKQSVKGSRISDVSFQPEIEVSFSEEISSFNIQPFISIELGSLTYSFSTKQVSDSVLKVSVSDVLPYYKMFRFKISAALSDEIGTQFKGLTTEFYTQLDSTDKFPVIDDEALLDLVQEETFAYFWDFGHPVSGLSRERNTSDNTVTSGGSGFGVMAIIVGIKRGYISRDEGILRLEKIVDFLGNADRFHGAWSHWLSGSTGEVIPFSEKDDGGDLVETSYMAMGLMVVRQYLNEQDQQEAGLINKINTLLDEIEWDWYTQGENSLTWHWSPTYSFEKNHKIRGWNEALITYIMAAASNTHTISKTVYEQGWGEGNNMINGNEFYNIILPLGRDYGGPLFFEQYSFIGLDPRNLSDQFADYWQQARNHTLINRQHCIINPYNYIAYSGDCWGLTASDGNNGYSAHAPDNDRGVITPTAALSSFPYTPEESMDALKHFYYKLGDRIWGQYGFFDAFNVTENWYATSNIAIEEGPIILMIENYRSGLLWDLFMSAPEIQSGLTKLGFTY